MPRITPIHWRELERFFVAAGFKFARQEGSHRSYTKPALPRPIVIPTYDEIPVSIISVKHKLHLATLARVSACAQWTLGFNTLK
jgi:predicted RNA binding protein YcfA (HicA-like mRNA interferase family)